MKMRQIAVVSLCLAVAAVAAAGQKQTKTGGAPATPVELFSLTDPQQINRDISEMLAAWQLGDVEMLRRFYADDVVVISGLDQPPIDGWRNYLAAYQEQHRRVQSGQIIRRNTYVQVHGDVAWASYQWEFGGLVDGQASQLRGHTTLIFERRVGSWRIVLNHTSLDAAALPASPSRSTRLEGRGSSPPHQD